MSRTRRTQPDVPDELKKVLEDLDIKHWHYLLIGDGSGSTITRSVGWACIAVEQASKAEWVFEGAYSNGTNNLAELMAYLQALDWLHGYRERTQDCGFTDVHVLTDAKWIANTGNQEWATSSHLPLWNAIWSVKRWGIRLKFHWVERDRIFANRVTHHLANGARVSLDASKKAARIQQAKQSAGGRESSKLIPWRQLTPRK